MRGFEVLFGECVRESPVILEFAVASIISFLQFSTLKPSPKLATRVAPTHTL